MSRLDAETCFLLLALVPFLLVCVAAVLAVFGRAYRNFPHQPGESKVFRRYSLPRSRLLCFQFFERHKPEPKHVRHRRT